MKYTGTKHKIDINPLNNNWKYVEIDITFLLIPIDLKIAISFFIVSTLLLVHKFMKTTINNNTTINPIIEKIDVIKVK